MTVYPKRFFEKTEPIEEGLCFVIMSLSPKSDSIYHIAIKPTVETLGMKCVRIDDIYYIGQPIVTTILSTLQKAELVIVDITKKDPNVFYELGFAHATKDNVIIMSQAPEDLPFDLNLMRLIVYDNTAPGIENLKLKLEKEIERLKRKPDFSKYELFTDKESLPKVRESDFNENHYHSLLTKILDEKSTSAPGIMFEELVAYLLDNTGFKVTARQPVFRIGDLDIRIDMVVWNELDIPSLQLFENPIVVECKVTNIVDATLIDKYIAYLTSTGLNTAFLFSAGQFSTDAISQALKASSRRIYLILFDMMELKEISSEQDFIDRIEDKVRRIALYKRSL